MRMLIIALAALPISAATAEPAPTVETVATPATGTESDTLAKRSIEFVELDPEKQCPKPLVHEATPDPSPDVKKLTELPPANAYHAVYRLDEEGCLDPVMVGYQYRDGR